MAEVRKSTNWFSGDRGSFHQGVEEGGGCWGGWHIHISVELGTFLDVEEI